MEIKICCKCKEEKNVCGFNKSKRNKSGYRGECKKCQNKSYLYNVEHYKKKRRKRYELNKELELKRNKIYYKNNKQIIIDKLRIKK